MGFQFYYHRRIGSPRPHGLLAAETDGIRGEAEDTGSVFIFIGLKSIY
jgi:hypothetical protein